MRKNFLTIRGASYGALLVALMLGSTFARASTDFRIAVRDMDGAPLPGATIWFMGEAFIDKPVEAEAFADLVERYGPDVDFTCSHGPVTELIIERADESGSLVLELESNEVRALKRSPLHMAVFKRGFAPKVLTAPHRVSGSHVMVIKLKPLATPADAKLLEFDRLRGSANLARLQGLGEPGGARESKRIRAALTALAAALHRDARDDEASVVYYGIACLPTVDYSEDASGIVVHGYTNGFSDSDPWRVEARNLARQLNRSNPQLQFEAVLARYSPRGNEYIGDWMASEDRKRLIAESKDFAPGTAIDFGPGHIPSCGRPTLPKATLQRAAGPSRQCTRQCLNTRTPQAGKKFSAITKGVCTTATRALQPIAHCRSFPSRSPIESIARRP